MDAALGPGAARGIVFDEEAAVAIERRLRADGYTVTVSRERFAGEDDDETGDDDTSSQVQNLPAPAGAPQGGVATGLGGTAPGQSDALALGLATGGGLLLTGAGALVAIRRRTA